MLAASLATLAVAGCGGDDGNGAQITVETTSPPPASGGEVVNVEIRGRAFEPQTVELSVGDTVVWKNASDEEHTVTSESFDSRRIPAEFGTFQHQFVEPGTVEYRCDIHPDEMEARVAVMNG